VDKPALARRILEQIRCRHHKHNGAKENGNHNIAEAIGLHGTKLRQNMGNYPLGLIAGEIGIIGYFRCMANIIVLGAGMVGSAMALDLATKHSVTSADISPKALLPLAEQGIATTVADLSTPEHIRKLVAGFDLVVGAVPGFLGF